jgi:hypothetical protein
MKELMTKEIDSAANPAKSSGKCSLIEDAFICFFPKNSFNLLTIALTTKFPKKIEKVLIGWRKIIGNTLKKSHFGGNITRHGELK